MEAISLDAYDPPKMTYHDLSKSERRQIKNSLDAKAAQIFIEVCRQEGIASALEKTKRNFNLNESDTRYNYIVHRLIKTNSGQSCAKPLTFAEEKRASMLMDGYVKLVKDFINKMKSPIENKILKFNLESGISVPLIINGKEEVIPNHFKTIINVLVDNLNAKDLKRSPEEIFIFIFDNFKNELEEFWDNFDFEMPCVSETSTSINDYVGQLQHHKIKIPRVISSSYGLEEIANELVTVIKAQIESPPAIPFLNKETCYEKGWSTINSSVERKYVAIQVIKLLTKKFPKIRRKDLQKCVILFGAKLLKQKIPSNTSKDIGEKI